jgi:hypothetical protein
MVNCVQVDGRNTTRHVSDSDKVDGTRMVLFINLGVYPLEYLKQLLVTARFGRGESFFLLVPVHRDDDLW